MKNLSLLLVLAFSISHFNAANASEQFDKYLDMSCQEFMSSEDADEFMLYVRAEIKKDLGSDICDKMLSNDEETPQYFSESDRPYIGSNDFSRLLDSHYKAFKLDNE